MAIRNLRWEDDEILKKRSRDVLEVSDKIRELAQDMLETMHRYDGLGLAAPQVGILKRVIVVDLYEENTKFVFINPVILKQKGEQIVDEGCLSFPDKFAKVKRPKEITIQALDMNGKEIKMHAKDLLAQAISHEIDHLNGIVFTEIMEPGTMEIVSQEEKERRRNEANKKK